MNMPLTTSSSMNLLKVNPGPKMNQFGLKCHQSQVWILTKKGTISNASNKSQKFSLGLVMIPMNEAKENLTRCDYCYSFHFEQGYARRMIESLQDFINTNTIQKVYFVLNGNDEDHKLTASFIASNLKMIDANRPAYLSYYSFHQGKLGNDLTEFFPILL